MYAERCQHRRGGVPASDQQRTEVPALEHGSNALAKRYRNGFGLCISLSSGNAQQCIASPGNHLVDIELAAGCKPVFAVATRQQGRGLSPPRSGARAKRHAHIRSGTGSAADNGG